jgi:hypothetical protein
MSTTSSSGTKSSNLACEHCGIKFNSLAEKEEHIKLEHTEHKKPSGVG